MQFFEIKWKLWHPCEILNAVHKSKMAVIELRKRKKLLLSESTQREAGWAERRSTYRLAGLNCIALPRTDSSEHESPSHGTTGIISGLPYEVVSCLSAAGGNLFINFFSPLKQGTFQCPI